MLTIFISSSFQLIFISTNTNNSNYVLSANSVIMVGWSLVNGCMLQFITNLMCTWGCCIKTIMQEIEISPAATSLIGFPLWQNCHCKDSTKPSWPTHNQRLTGIENNNFAGVDACCNLNMHACKNCGYTQWLTGCTPRHLQARRKENVLQSVQNMLAMSCLMLGSSFLPF